MSSSRENAAVPSAGRHLLALDGVRGIAILLVMAHHFTHYARLRPESFFDRGVVRLLETGWFGVDFFFVLSGFLITGILLDTRDDPHYFRTFYARRVLRILPLYYATLAVWFFLLPQLMEPPRGFDALFAEQGWYWVHLVNIEVALGGWPTANHLAHFWSLAIEEQFYLVWPLVVLKTTRRGLIRVCIACIVAATLLRAAFLLIGSDPVAVYVSTLCRMDQLALGGLVAIWIRRGITVSQARRFARVFLLVGGAGLAAHFSVTGRLDTLDPTIATVGYSLTGLIGAGLVLLAVSSRREGLARRLLSSAPLVAMGRYSYALYVVHHPVIVILGNRGIRGGLLPELAGSRLPGLVLVALFAGLVSFIIAFASWHLLESPFLSLKRYVRYRRLDRRAGIAPA